MFVSSPLLHESYIHVPHVLGCIKLQPHKYSLICIQDEYGQRLKQCIKLLLAPK